ncbi:MAG: hypothetical protein JRH20_01495 [Deltaproteobacteria bacterium]|nr:hypothetical protein [Deltaproteobacteria bacterium]
MDHPLSPYTPPPRNTLTRPTDLPPLSHYFSDEEFRRGHPDPGTPIYHSAEHSRLVRLLAFELAKADGLEAPQTLFVSEVALLHDWDPERVMGSPARVPTTIRRLARDFVGKRPLLSSVPTGTSLLKTRFHWTKSQLNMAIAMIYRTEFPFEGAHSNPYYYRTSPAERYRRSLRILDPNSRRFVLRQAPLLAKYADQMSWYATQPFLITLRAVEGLVEELNHRAPTGSSSSRRLRPSLPKVTTQELNTTGFLCGISDPRSLEVDLRIADELGVHDLKLPSQDEILTSLPEVYRRTFHANHAAFNAYDHALTLDQTELEAKRVGLATFHRELAQS